MILADSLNISLNYISKKGCDHLLYFFKSDPFIEINRDCSPVHVTSCTRLSCCSLFCLF